MASDWPRGHLLNHPTVLPHPGCSWLLGMWTKCQGKGCASQWSLPIEIRGLNKSWISCSLACGTEMLFCSKCKSLGKPRREAAESFPRAASSAPGVLSPSSPSSLFLFPPSHSFRCSVAIRGCLFPSQLILTASL